MAGGWGPSQALAVAGRCRELVAVIAEHAYGGGIQQRELRVDRRPPGLGDRFT